MFSQVAANKAEKSPFLGVARSKLFFCQQFALGPWTNGTAILDRLDNYIHLCRTHRNEERESSCSWRAQVSLIRISVFSSRASEMTIKERESNPLAHAPRIQYGVKWILFL